jgi:hypothetical protein
VTGTVPLVTTVIAALVTGALAGALPSIMTTRRRRLLKLLTDEAALLEKVKDEASKADLVQAMRTTSMLYKLHVEDSQRRSARQRLFRFAPYLMTIVIY